ncbi:MAG: PAS domain S-box protein [Bacteroidales bacterium]|nr:PAS domain S-box protein [Bacteroidales bacterium]
MGNLKQSRNENEDALLIGLMKNIEDLVFRFEYQPYPHFTYVSPSSIRFVGYTPEEYYSDPGIANKIIHPDDLEYFLNITKSNDPVHHYELRWIKKDGSIIWTEHQVKKTFDHNQHLTAVEGIVRNISNRKETEQNLRESELRYRTLFDASNDFVFLHEFDSQESPGYFQEVNDYSCKKLGYTKQEFQSLRPCNIVIAAEADQITSETKELFNKKELNFEKTLLAKDGTTIPVEINARKFEYKGKKMVLSIGRDISMKKETEALSAFLNNAAMELLEFTTVQQVLKYTAHKLYSLLDETGIVTVTTFDNPGNHWKMVDVKGINKTIDKVCKAVGLDIRNLEGPIKTAFLPDLENGKITELELDLYQLFNGALPKAVAGTLIKALPFNKLFVIALKKSNTIYGTVSIITTPKSKAINIPITDLFIGQISIFIQKIQAQQELRESEAKFKRMFFDNQSIMLLIDPDTGIILDANRSALNFYGYSYDEIRKLKIYDINTSTEEEVYHEMQLLIEKKKNVFRFRHRLANKQLRDVEVYSGRFQSNEKTLIYSTIYDITERLKVEEEIKLSEEKFRKVFLTSPDAININRLGDGMYVSVNNGFTQIMGYTSEDTSGKTSVELDIWNRLEDRFKLLQGLKEKGVVENLEAKFRAKNGDLKDGLMSAAIMNLNGTPHIISITRDITDRKRSDQIQKVLYEISKFSNKNLDLRTFLFKLHEQINTILNARNFYVSLYNSLSDTYTFPYYEDETEDYENLLPIKMNGSLTEFVRREGKGVFLACEDKDVVIKSEKIIPYGNPAKVWLGAPLISGSSNEVIGVIAIQDYKNKDAFNKKDLEILEIIAFNIGVFVERIQNLQELKQAKERAEESDRLKSAFLANMSHEIRTPMNGILGFANLLREPDISKDEQKQFVEIIGKSGERMLNIINDLIDVSKIEAGQMEVIMSEANINDQLEFLHTFFKPEAEAKNIDLSYTTALPNKSATIITDREKLYAILTNLLKNAIKFTNEGSIQYGYVLKEKAIEFFVKDTGMGIAKNRQQAIFERFVQADLTISKPYEGAGLGLTITKAYVEMLGGEIHMESELGKGAIFYFTLPFNTKISKPKNTDYVKVTDQNADALAHLNILVAEDDETAFYYLKALLKSKCKSLTRAITGVEAVEALRQNPDIDLLLMDIKMPDMDGYEATQKIRTFNNNVKIIAQTAYALSGDRERALVAGCNEYVAKPVKKDELFSIIKKLFTTNS